MTENMQESAIAHALRTMLNDAIREEAGFSGFYIDGVEVTQAIQYRRAADHLTDPADRGPDNSIRLVAGKPGYVRVYLRSRWARTTNVSATVTVQRMHYGVWVDSGTLTPDLPGSISAEVNPAYATERGSLWNSLNFFLPAEIMRGQLRLKVHAAVNGEPNRSADAQVDLDVSLLQTLRVRGIPVRYWGKDAAGNQVRLPEPTLADFLRTAATALTMFPVEQNPDIGLTGIFTQMAPLTGQITIDPTTKKAVCPLDWQFLLIFLKMAKAADGNRADRLYYALLPNGMPLGGAGGCGSGGGVGAGPIDGGMAMAHELGHVLGFGHAPCGLVNGDTGDTNYPAYEPYDTPNKKQASIGEYGLDATNPTVYSPNTSRDFMSYCQNWISPYHYLSLLQHPLLDPRWVKDPRGSKVPNVEKPYLGRVPQNQPDPPWGSRRIAQNAIRLQEAEPRAMIVLTGLVDGARVDVHGVLRLETLPGAAGVRVPGMSVELLDGQGQVLQRTALMRMPTYAGCDCGCDGDGEESTGGVFEAEMPDPGEGSVLRIVRDGEAVWERQASAEPPNLTDLTASVEGDNLLVRWAASTTSEAEVLRFLRWSDDEGRTWQLLAFQLDHDEAEVPLHLLPGGRVLVRAFLSDGFYTAVSDPVAVELPARPPQVAILHPAGGDTLRTQSPLRLWGAAAAGDGRPLEGEALQWEIDGQAVGSGVEVWAQLPEWEGEHCLTLRATDRGLTGEASLTFLANNTGEPPYRIQAC
jgi:hypothetical protein